MIALSLQFYPTPELRALLREYNAMPYSPTVAEVRAEVVRELNYRRGKP